LTAEKIEMAIETHRKELAINKVEVMANPTMTIEVNPEPEI